MWMEYTRVQHVISFDLQSQVPESVCGRSSSKAQRGRQRTMFLSILRPAPKGGVGERRSNMGTSEYQLPQRFPSEGCRPLQSRTSASNSDWTGEVGPSRVEDGQVHGIESPFDGSKFSAGPSKYRSVPSPSRGSASNGFRLPKSVYRLEQFGPYVCL